MRGGGEIELTLLLILLLLTPSFCWEGQLLHQALASNKNKYNATTWNLPLMKGVMKGQLLKVTRLDNPDNPWHSCYAVTCSGNHCADVSWPNKTYIDFCYPAIIVTGLPKCGTSAMYDLLTRYSGSLLGAEKENCPYTRRRSHWEFFHTLPRVAEVTTGRLVVDGCIDITKNLLMREIILRRPKTLYILMIRNYADMLWSSYNFWCKREYDGFNCDNTRWVKRGMLRSPEIFHGLIERDLNDTLSPNDSPFHKGPPDMSKPCRNAGGYYTEYLDLVLFPSVPRSEVLVLASEEMEANPLSVWSRVWNKLQTPRNRNPNSSHHFVLPKTSPYNFTLGSFVDRRYNAQINLGSKGGGGFLPRKDYKPGVFEISGFQPMSPATRVLLDKCWSSDCTQITKLVGWYDGYPCAT